MPFGEALLLGLCWHEISILGVCYEMQVSAIKLEKNILAILNLDVV